MLQVDYARVPLPKLKEEIERLERLRNKAPFGSEERELLEDSLWLARDTYEDRL